MRYLLLFALLVVAGSLPAQVSWQAKELVQDAELGSKGLLYTFYGKNEGAEAVKITSLRASCPCLQVSSDKMEISAGETILVLGELDPFEIGGEQKQRIIVHYDEKKMPDVLTLVAQLPVTVNLAPSRLFWKANGEPEGQVITITLAADQNIELSDIYAMDENFYTRLETVDTKKYTLTVTPRDLTVRRPVAVMLRYRLDGRHLKTTIPCLIGDRNPFEFNFKLRPKPQTGAEIEQSIIRQSRPDISTTGNFNLRPSSDKPEPNL